MQTCTIKFHFQTEPNVRGASAHALSLTSAAGNVMRVLQMSACQGFFILMLDDRLSENRDTLFIFYSVSNRTFFWETRKACSGKVCSSHTGPYGRIKRSSGRIPREGDHCATDHPILRLGNQHLCCITRVSLWTKANTALVFGVHGWGGGEMQVSDVSVCTSSEDTSESVSSLSAR